MPGAAELRDLAVRARVDPRTIARELRAAQGDDTPARGDAGARARAVLRAAGLIGSVGRLWSDDLPEHIGSIMRRGGVDR